MVFTIIVLNTAIVSLLGDDQPALEPSTFHKGIGRKLIDLNKNICITVSHKCTCYTKIRNPFHNLPSTQC